jgi:hypothetical protein
MKKKLSHFAAICCVMLSGCTTYHISTVSMLQQFADAPSEEKVTNFAPTGGLLSGLYFIQTVRGNSLMEITVLDKNEQEYVLPVTNTTGVRITKKNGRKTTFYFNTLLLKDSTITGSKTHFFNAQIKPIPFMDIAKIELQKH